MPITRTYKDKFFPTDKAQLAMGGQTPPPSFPIVESPVQPAEKPKPTFFQGLKVFCKKWLTALYR